MPMTLLQQKARAKYITVKEFKDQYSMSQSQAYKILAMPEMKDAIIKTGTRNKKVDIDKAYELMRQLFN